MHLKKLLTVVASLGIAAGITFASVAHADDEFDVSVAGGKVVVSAKGAWHVNKDYPWKLTAGDVKLDKAKFSFTETTATLAGAPKGTAILKGGVCNGGQCKNFEKAVSVQ
jgi:hypothetical protein